MSTQTSTSITPVGYHCIVCLLMKDTLGAHQRHFSYNSEIRDWLRVFINNHTCWSMFTITEPRCMSRRCRTTRVGYVHTSREVSIYSPQSQRRCCPHEMQRSDTAGKSGGALTFTRSTCMALWEREKQTDFGLLEMVCLLEAFLAALTKSKSLVATVIHHHDSFLQMYYSCLLQQ